MQYQMSLMIYYLVLFIFAFVRQYYTHEVMIPLINVFFSDKNSVSKLYYFVSPSLLYILFFMLIIMFLMLIKLEN